MKIHIKDKKGKTKVMDLEKARGLLSEEKLSGEEYSWIPGTSDWIKLSDRDEFRNYKPPEIRDPHLIVHQKKVISHKEAISEVNDESKSKSVFLLGVPFAWRRLWARFIDVGFGRVLFEILATIIFIETNWWPSYESNPIEAYLGTFLAFAIFLLVFETISVYIFQTTVGKLIFGMQVRNWEGGRITFFSAFFRTFLCYAQGLWFFFAFPYITFFSIYISYKNARENNEYPWDDLADTTVFYKRIWFPRLFLGVILGLCCLIGFIAVKAIVKEILRSVLSSSGLVY